MIGRGRLARAVRWRFGSSLLTLITVALAVAAATVAPLYLRAAGDSLVRSGFASAPESQVGVNLTSNHGPGSLAATGAAEAAVETSSGRSSLFGPALTTVNSGVGLTSGLHPFASALFSRTGVCSVLHLMSGHCPTSPGQVMLSDRSARVLGGGLGQAVDASVPGRSTPLYLEVSGVYRVPNLTLPYWWGLGPSDFPFGISNQQHVLQLDPLITTAATAVAVPPLDAPLITGQVPLRTANVDLATESRLQQALRQSTTTVAERSDEQLESGATALLAQIDDQRHLMTTIVLVATLQLLVLVLWVLGSLITRSSEIRQQEIRLARLRGFPRRSLLGVSVAEPFALCAAGLPVGIGLAWLAVEASRSRLFAPHTEVLLSGWTLAAFALVVAAIVVAVVVSTGQLRRRGPDVSLLTPSAPPGSAAQTRRGRTGPVVDVVLVVLAVASLCELAATGVLAGGRTDPLASAAPALIALGVAVVGVWMTLLAARLLITATRGSTRVATFLAARQIGRRPVLVRQTRILVVALCLASFATAAWWVAKSNRQTVARFTVGASTVLTVNPDPGVDLTEAVDRADPSGHLAMAAAVVRTPSSILLAVDSSRLARVAEWPRGLGSVARVSAALDPKEPPEVLLTGSAVRFDATVVDAAGTAGVAGLDLEAWTFDERDGTTTLVNAGPIRLGAASYPAGLGATCSTGCRLEGIGVIGLSSRPPAPSTINFTLTGIEPATPPGHWQSVAADLSSRSGWQSMGAPVSVAEQPGGLSFVIPPASLAGYEQGASALAVPLVGPADVPTVLPAAVTTQDASLNGAILPSSQVPVQGLDGNTLEVHPEVDPVALPAVGSNAVLVDLDLAERSQTEPSIAETSYQVWLAPGAPSGLVGRLQAEGLRVTATERAATVQSALNRQGPALADDFLLLAAAAALLLGVAATVAAFGAATRQRATEMVALEAAGIPRHSLVSSLLGETLVLVVACVLGAAAGLVGVALALHSLPELAVPPGGPILRYGLPVGPITIVLGVVLAASLAGAVTAQMVVVRRMSPRLLRESPE
jgi:putative ABC transport system permease protein